MGQGSWREKKAPVSPDSLTRALVHPQYGSPFQWLDPTTLWDSFFTGQLRESTHAIGEYTGSLVAGNLDLGCLL